MNRVYARIDTSFAWPLKAFAALGVLLLLQAFPDVFIILTWVAFFAAMILWARACYYEDSGRQQDLTDTQDIPIIRNIRCPQCGKEQLAPADQVVTCDNQHCKKRLRVPGVGPKIEVICPMCDADQSAEPGTRHTCTGCGYTDFVRYPERIKPDMETAA